MQNKINFEDVAHVFSTVLIVEDEPAHAKLISRALNSLVGDISHVSSGAEAIRVLETQLVELVFCDLHLPDVDGLALIKEIRSARPDLPIIILTSSQRIDDAVTAMRQGAWDFMVKNFDEDLPDKIRILVARNAERKQSFLEEQKIRAERDAFWAAANTAPDGLAILGAKGHIVYSNEHFDTFRSQVAAPQTEVSNIIDLVAIHDFKVAARLYARLNGVEGASLLTDELVIHILDSEGHKLRRHFEITLSTMSLKGVSELSLQSELIPDLRRAVVWVRETTRQREQEKFQRDLLSTTSHDLKGPLGAILTSGELLEFAELTPEDQQKMFTRISSCARNAISIIDELLSARRIQDGVLVVKPRLYQVADILEDVHLDYLPMAKAKSIDLSCLPVSPAMQVYADRIGLNRVLGNLVSNAIKFTPEGGAVDLHATEDEEAVSISVSDTGSGIEASSRHFLFDRYTRLEKHQHIEGTGLGLYVVKNIMDAHAARIQVISEVGIGTTFILSFPKP